MHFFIQLHFFIIISYLHNISVFLSFFLEGFGLNNNNNKNRLHKPHIFTKLTIVDDVCTFCVSKQTFAKGTTAAKLCKLNFQSEKTIKQFEYTTKKSAQQLSEILQERYVISSTFRYTKSIPIS